MRTSRHRRPTAMTRLHFAIIASTLLLTLGATAHIARSDYQELQKPAEMSASNPGPSLKRSTQHLGNLSRAEDLFGNATLAPANTPAAHRALPKTQLKLVLSGTFTHHDHNKSSALIGNNARQSKRYRVGDTLPGGAELIAVHKGSVTLRRQGRDELLQFARRKTSASHPPTRTASINRQGDAEEWSEDDF